MVMKKSMVVAALAAMTFAAAPAAAQEDSGGPGCGLGSQLFAGQSGMMPQLFASTTNQLAMNSFAMTSGTSGCTQDGIVMRDQERRIFAAVNLPQLKQDMARGDGDYLDALAALMAILPADRGVFSTVAKETVAITASADVDGVLSAFDSALAQRLAFHTPAQR